MQFRAEEYYKASLERMKQSRAIYDDGNGFALAMYCGGLAVECLLRAFRWKSDAGFEGRHDLSELLKASRLLRVEDEYLRRRGASEEKIEASVNQLRLAIYDIAILWHNNLRFSPETSLKAYLTRIGRVKGIKGDPLKKNAIDLINAAQTVIDRGVALWGSKTKS